MILHDISESPHSVIKRSAILDPEIFGHSDLNRLHVFPTPQRLEPRVREAQIQQVENWFLAQEVVDPEQLILSENLA